MEKYKNILLKSINDEIYYDNEDLRVNKKQGILLTRKEMNEYLSF